MTTRGSTHPILRSLPARSALRPMDALWFGIDEPHQRAVVTAVVTLAADIDAATLRTLLRTRLVDTVPRFASRMRRRPVRHWQRVAVDLDHHVAELVLGPPGDDDALAAAVGTLLAEPLDFTRPLWRVVLVHGHGGGSALVWRIHHSLGDGSALVGLLLSMTEPADEPATARPPEADAAPERRRRSPWRALAATVPVCWAIVRLPHEPHTPLRGPLGTTKRASWTAPLPLGDVKSVARAYGVTVNDVALALTAGALRAYALERGAEPVDVRIFSPVDLRHGRHDPLGNRFGIVLCRLPVSTADPVARLLAVHATTTALKAGQQARATYVALTVAGRLPARVQRLASRVLSARATAAMSNVRGPSGSLTLAGVPVTRLMFWVPQLGSVNCGVSVVSYAGSVTIGVSADALVVPDPARITGHVAAQLAALLSRD